MIRYLWLIPVIPLLAAFCSAFLSKNRWRVSATLAIGGIGISCLLSLAALSASLQLPEGGREVVNFTWLDFSASELGIPQLATSIPRLQLGLVLDPLSASMLVMVTFISTLIFIYSVGYMSHDENPGRFFCFLSLFASAMLGLILSNSLLLLFMCWELVGLASYLLIGFWFHKPQAAAAAKKAFITTRIGDIGFLIGILWLYTETGTLLFYDGGKGCLEQSALTLLVAQTTAGGMAVSTAIALLLFCGAIGKSGQLPLHVWLPDAMEGPTPVSALIHAATMVAAGVFLMARIFPLLDADASGIQGLSPALTTMAWVGSITAVFAALVAVAQNDIKRILAYSTVSQLGYMFLGLATGGVPVGMLHLLTHAFFKALLFLGAGSVIHGCHEEQDIRKMGGLKDLMPQTFRTYAIGMMALSGVPLVFSGFWSKDGILHAAVNWQVSKWPFALGLVGAFLTAFYMTRQIALVFFGVSKQGPCEPLHPSKKRPGGDPHAHPPAAGIHESPPIMTTPLVVLAASTILLTFLATPVWPWIESYLSGHLAHFELKHLFQAGTLAVLLLSTVVVFCGIAAGWALYGASAVGLSRGIDPLQARFPTAHRWLTDKLYFDEVYEAVLGSLLKRFSRLSAAVDEKVIAPIVSLVPLCIQALAWVSRLADEFLVNPGFDTVCTRIVSLGTRLSSLHSGQIQQYLAALAMGVVALGMWLAWISQ